MYKKYFGIRYIIFFCVIGLITFLISGCSDDQSGSGQFSMPPMPVEVATVNLQKMVDQFETIGTIEANEEVTIVSEIDGYVVRTSHGLE